MQRRLCQSKYRLVKETRQRSVTGDAVLTKGRKSSSSMVDSKVFFLSIGSSDKCSNSWNTETLGQEPRALCVPGDKIGSERGGKFRVVSTWLFCWIVIPSHLFRSIGCILEGSTHESRSVPSSFDLRFHLILAIELGWRGEQDASTSGGWRRQNRE